jgi:nucleoside-diphosphate-sugar epimerase
MKILLIGTKGFLGKNLLKILKNKCKLKAISFENFLKLKIKNLSTFDVIINTSITKEIVYNRYLKKNDRDRIICEKIVKLNNKFFMISTRKVYKKNSLSLNENSKIHLKNIYETNRYRSESKCQKLLKERLVILRPSNIVGFKKQNNLSVQKTFIDNFIIFKKKKIIPIVRNSFKDFISIKQFSTVVWKMLKKYKKCSGIYNISINKKIFLTKIVRWLLKYSKTKQKIVITEGYSENFTLNNQKLINLINYKISKKELMKFCENLGRRL